MTYQTLAPTKEEIDTIQGPLVLEFGVDWCPHCQAAQLLVDTLLKDRPEITHIKVEDGKGRRLGREFKVKLWPSLIFIKDGVEIARVVRPTDVNQLQNALDQTIS